MAGALESRRLCRPSNGSARSAVTHLYNIAPPSFFVTTDARSLTLRSHTSSLSTDDLVCQLCRAVVDRPIQLTTCNTLVCMACLSESLRNSEYHCPWCKGDHVEDLNTMVCPSSVVMKVLGDLLVTCDNCKSEIIAGTCHIHDCACINCVHT